jgi:hypothetical protein
MLWTWAMFIPLHVITILSVVFLVVLVLLAWRGRSSRSDLLQPPIVMPVTLPPEIDSEARELVRGGDKIEAVKLVRSATGLDLKDAKDLVDRMEGEW